MRVLSPEVNLEGNTSPPKILSNFDNLNTLSEDFVGNRGPKSSLQSSVSNITEEGKYTSIDKGNNLDHTIQGEKMGSSFTLENGKDINEANTQNEIVTTTNKATLMENDDEKKIYIRSASGTTKFKAMELNCNANMQALGWTRYGAQVEKDNTKMSMKDDGAMNDKIEVRNQRTDNADRTSSKLNHIVEDNEYRQFMIYEYNDYRIRDFNNLETIHHSCNTNKIGHINESSFGRVYTLNEKEAPKSKFMEFEGPSNLHKSVTLETQVKKARTRSNESNISSELGKISSNISSDTTGFSQLKSFNPSAVSSTIAKSLPKLEIHSNEVSESRIERDLPEKSTIEIKGNSQETQTETGENNKVSLKEGKYHKLDKLNSFHQFQAKPAISTFRVDHHTDQDEEDVDDDPTNFEKSWLSEGEKIVGRVVLFRRNRRELPLPVYIQKYLPKWNLYKVCFGGSSKYWMPLLSVNTILPTDHGFMETQLAKSFRENNYTGYHYLISLMKETQDNHDKLSVSKQNSGELKDNGGPLKDHSDNKVKNIQDPFKKTTYINASVKTADDNANNVNFNGKTDTQGCRSDSMHTSIDSSLDSTLYSSITSHNSSIEGAPNELLLCPKTSEIKQSQKDVQKVIESTADKLRSDFKAQNDINHLRILEPGISPTPQPSVASRKLSMSEENAISSCVNDADVNSKKRRRAKGVFKTEFQCSKCLEKFCNKQALGWHTRKGCRKVPTKTSFYATIAENDRHFVEHTQHHGANFNISNNIGGYPIQFLPITETSQPAAISLRKPIPTHSGFSPNGCNHQVNSGLQPVIRVTNYRPMNIPVTHFVQTPIIGISSNPTSGALTAHSIGSNGCIISGHDSKPLQHTIYPPSGQSSYHINTTHNETKFY